MNWGTLVIGYIVGHGTASIAKMLGLPWWGRALFAIAVPGFPYFR